MSDHSSEVHALKAALSLAKSEAEAAMDVRASMLADLKAQIAERDRWYRDLDAVAASLGVETDRDSILRTIERVRGDIKRKDRQLAEVTAQRDEARGGYDGRIQDIASEAFGPFPVLSPGEAMEQIEAGVFAQRQSNAELAREVDDQIGYAITLQRLIEALARGEVPEETDEAPHCSRVAREAGLRLRADRGEGRVVTRDDVARYAITIRDLIVHGRVSKVAADGAAMGVVRRVLADLGIKVEE